MIKIYEGNNRISEEIDNIQFKYVWSKVGGCDFIYNTSTEVGFLYWAMENYCVLIRVSKNKVDKFIDVYYNDEMPDPKAEYGIEEPEESDYYRVYKDKGIIDDFELMDETEEPTKIINLLLFGRRF